MRLLKAAFVLGLVTAAGIVQAAPSPGAIRVTVDGQTRVVRTIGQPTDPDFWAPLTKQLRSLWLDVQPNDLGDVDVRYGGDRVARLPLVTSVERLSATSDRPAVLRQGDELLVPVRAVVALGKGYVDWDERTRTLTLAPTVRKIELAQGDRGLEVRIEASAPVKVTSLQLPRQQSRPARVAIDVTPAWFGVEGAPMPAGVVTVVRLGQFTKETARITLELTDSPVRVIGTPQSGTAVTARLQPVTDGVAIARGAVDPMVVTPGQPMAGTPSAANPSRVAPAGALRRRLSVPRRSGRSLSNRGGFVQRDLGSLLEGDGPLLGRVICVDPGHGGWKAGAQGLNGLKEGDACLAMGLQLARALREAGATVLMTRETDVHVSLEDRWGFANLQRVDLFISIHCNATKKHNTLSGTETYYCTPQSLNLARALHSEVVRVMGGRDGGIRRRNFAVVRHTTMPSVLLEVGYIDHYGDEEKLGDPVFQEAFGHAVRDGVVRYFAGG
jgi:N-acetylmuramoyl-L-alanine amidase